MKTIAVIPARLESTRLPRKVLADIHGQPLIWHVWSRVSQAKNINTVYIATDSTEVQTVVENWGGQVLMTSPDCRSGTERIASCLDRLDADLILNVQGDEPLIDPVMLETLVQQWLSSEVDLVTPVYRITSLDELTDPNVVKVVCTESGTALYFSRSPVPFVRDCPIGEWLGQHTFWGHIGVYGYRRSALEAYSTLPISPLEQTERLEQLRFLAAGYRFQTVKTPYHPIAVDVPEDLDRVRVLMRERVERAP